MLVQEGLGAIAADGKPAVDFEIMKRQVEAPGRVAGFDNAKRVIAPTRVVGVIGSLQMPAEALGGRAPGPARRVSVDGETGDPSAAPKGS